MYVHGNPEEIIGITARIFILYPEFKQRWIPHPLGTLSDTGSVSNSETHCLQNQRIIEIMQVQFVSNKK
jgi:hypothetical protein